MRNTPSPVGIGAQKLDTIESITVLLTSAGGGADDLQQQERGKLWPAGVVPCNRVPWLQTGATALAFSSRRLIEALGKHPKAPDAARPSFEIAFTTDDVQAALDRALAAGARLQQKPERMPWGALLGQPLRILTSR